MEWYKNKGSGGDNADWADEQTWKPEEESELTGILVSKRTADTKWGVKTVLKIQDEEGTVWNVWGDRTALKQLLEEHDEQLIPGRVIGIRTEGKVKLDDGRSFYPYELGFGSEKKDDTKVAAAPAAASSKYDDEEPF